MEEFEHVQESCKLPGVRCHSVVVLQGRDSAGSCGAAASTDQRVAAAHGCGSVVGNVWWSGVAVARLVGAAASSVSWSGVEPEGVCEVASVQEEAEACPVEEQGQTAAVSVLVQGIEHGAGHVQGIHAREA